MSLTATGITLVMATHAGITNASSPNTKDVGQSGGDGAGGGGMANASFSYKRPTGGDWLVAHAMGDDGGVWILFMVKRIIFIDREFTGVLVVVAQRTERPIQ